MIADPKPSEIVLSVSEFVAVVNQSLEFAYPFISVEGEISELRVSKGRWVYFNLKDESSIIRVFATVYQVGGAYEDGMKVIVRGSPRLHNRYGFSLNLASLSASGEGSIKRAFEKLRMQLEGEGLFASDRKRPIPELPARIGLITSAQAAAYNDFLTILNSRWSGVEILHADVGVQGDSAVGQIVSAITYFSQMSSPPDVLVVIRGGGSAEDLMAFSDERVVRTLAASRVPTIVGVGHDDDVSLADLVADVRATTPTNAAQLVVPDREAFAAALHQAGLRAQHRIETAIAGYREDTQRIDHMFSSRLDAVLAKLVTKQRQITVLLETQLTKLETGLGAFASRLADLNPLDVLKRGYALVRDDGNRLIHRAAQVRLGMPIVVQFSDDSIRAEVIDGKE